MKRYLTLKNRPSSKRSPYVQGSASSRVNTNKLEEETKKLESWNNLK